MALEEPLYEYIRSNNLLSEQEINIIKTCTNDIREMTPTDKPLVFRKSEKVTDDSQKLSWLIYSIKVKLSDITSNYKRVKDPEYTMLVRQQRPSGAAIEAELRFRNDTLYEIEKKIETIDNIIAYLNHLQLSIDRYLRILNDKLRYN